MTISILALKGKLNGKILLLRFFFCRVYNDKNNHFMSLKAVELGSLVHVWNISNQYITGQAFSETVTLQNP